MKKSTKIIIAVISILVIAAAVFAVLYFTTDLFKTKNPKKAFEEYLNNAIASNEGISYEKMISSLKKSQSESMEAKGSMSMNVELASSVSDSETEAIIELLNNLDLNFEVKENPKTANLYATVNAKYNESDLGTIEILANKEEVAIKFAEIYDKYLTMPMDELLESMDIDMYDIEDAMEDIDFDELISILEISDSEISRIVNRYKDVLVKTIPEDNYSSEKEKITVNGEEIEATAYIVKLSDKDLIKLAKAMINSLSEDDDTIKLVVDKANSIMKLTGDTSTKLTVSNVKSLLETAVGSLDDVDELTGEKIEIKVYEYKKETVRVAFEMADNAIMIDTTKNDNTEKMAIKMVDSGEEMTLLNIEQTKKSDNAYVTKLSTDIEGVKLEIEADTEVTDSKEKVDMKLYVEAEDVIKATLNINVEAEYKTVSIDKLSASNSVEISNLTQANATELMEGLSKYIEDKIDVIKEIATVLGYEDEIEELEDELKSLTSQTTSDDDVDLDEEGEDLEEEDDEDVA